MNWRTDKPTADVIVAKLKYGGYETLYKYDLGYCFLDHEDKGEEYDVPFGDIIKWADLEEDETVTDCHQLEEELDAFLKSGKAIKEENCGTYTTTYIDPLKVARHFAKWGAEHLKR